MHVIGHNNRDVELIFLAVIMAAGGHHDIACHRRHYPTELRDERDEVRREILLQVRQVATIKLHGRMLPQRREQESKIDW